MNIYEYVKSKDIETLKQNIYTLQRDISKGIRVKTNELFIDVIRKEIQNKKTCNAGI